jgi:hypothetical protein
MKNVPRVIDMDAAIDLMVSVSAVACNLGSRINVRDISILKT